MGEGLTTFGMVLKKERTQRTTAEEYIHKWEQCHSVEQRQELYKTMKKVSKKHVEIETRMIAIWYFDDGSAYVAYPLQIGGKIIPSCTATSADAATLFLEPDI